ncbi:MAG: outer membrane autotransporter barrel protein, partial [Rhodospirillaceae bacterium]
MYQPYTSSTFVPFVSSLSSTQGAEVNLTVGDMARPQAITMDTGSIGLQVSTDIWNPGSLTPIGAGSITLNSSGVTNSGNFYSVPVNFFSDDTRGSMPVATANVPVLVVTQSKICPPGSTVCTTVNNPGSIFYMGVGLNRTAGENLVTPNAQQVNGQTLNPFLNITQIAGQAVPAGTIRQGYIIDTANGATGGVTLGLTQTNTQGMSFVKLGANASGSLDNWNTAPMSVTVTNGGTTSTASSGGNPPGGSGVLPDAGINYMFLSPVPGNVVTQPCTLSGGTRNCLPDGTQVQISLPGNGAASSLAQYSFTVGGAGGNVVQPAAVATLHGSPFVNTGREFFLGFQYLYDSVGGYVGYAAQPALGASGSVNPGVALIGQVDLAPNFSNYLPVFLIGDTTLAQTGSGSIAGAIAGAFGLTIGSGSVTLGGANTYTGGTFVSSGAALIGTTTSLQGAIANNGSVTFNQDTAGTYAGNMSGTGSVALQGGGTVNLTGINTYTGPTTVSNGLLKVNGSITSDVTVGPGGSLGGAGTIFGNVVNNGALAPGNSIGTLAVNGSYTQAAGSLHAVEANAQGQADRLNVSGAPGTATIAAGTRVFVAPAATGPYAPRTSYTILNASGGVAGAYSSVASALPFLLPSLSYDANNVYLTLQVGGFARQAQTSNQAAVGTVLDA